MLHYPYLISRGSKSTLTLYLSCQRMKRHMMVMTCIKEFSKMVQLVPLQESDACTIADKFLSTVVSQHTDFPSAYYKRL